MSFGGITRWVGNIAPPLVKLSMVPGCSFLDLGAVRNLAQYADGEHVVWLIDPVGKVAKMDLDRPGTVETFGAELILVEADRDFSADTGFWVENAGCDINVTTPGKVHFAASTGMYTAGIAIPAASLSRVTGTISSYVSGNLLIRPAGASATAPYVTGDGVKTLYATGGTGGVSSFSYSIVPLSLDLDDISWKQVLIPSATAAWAIRRRDNVSAFEREDTGFSRNAASYRVEIAYQPRAAIMYSIPRMMSPNPMRLTLMPRPYFTVTSWDQRFKGTQLTRQFVGTELPRRFKGTEFVRRFVGTEISR